MMYVGLASGLFLLRFAAAHQAKLRVQLYLIVLSGLFLFSAFRYRVGCDWSGYFFQFVAAETFDWSSFSATQEPIWWGILTLMQMFELPYPVANVISSAVFFIGVHVLAKRQPDPLGFLVLMFPILIINMPMSGIRQGAAIGMMCIAFCAFIDRRPLRFAFWVAVAMGFHSSAVVFFLLVPVASGRYSLDRLVLAALLAVVAAGFLATTSAAELATQRYIGTGVDAAGASFRLGILGLTAVYFYFFIRKQWLHNWPQDYPLASIGAIAMLCTLVVLPVSTVIGDRFGYYLIPIQAMIFARLPWFTFRSGSALHKSAPYLGLLLMFTVWTQFSSLFSQCYLPYQSWIFGFPGGDAIGL